jgi:hypothetical protein
MGLKPKKNLPDVRSWFFADYCGKLLTNELKHKSATCLCRQAGATKVL